MTGLGILDCLSCRNHSLILDSIEAAKIGTAPPLLSAPNWPAKWVTDPADSHHEDQYPSTPVKTSTKRSRRQKRTSQEPTGREV